MKVALGMIIRNLLSSAELIAFIDNAEKHGHELDCVIAAYSQKLDPKVAETLCKRIPFHAIDIKNPDYCKENLRRIGVSEKTAQTLLECPVDPMGGPVPYGYKRTLLTTEAILRGMDVLFFVDSDVHPAVLKMTQDGAVTEDADFFGAHLSHLNSGSLVTTGEYSGYNILPPASFDGMDDLLYGLQKEDMLEYWQNSEKHRCLYTQPAATEPKPCTKILGGNCAITLSAFSALPPFFSSFYRVGGELFLNRGEDTVLGLGIAKTGTVCTDVGLNPLHDTYKNYPAEPDLRGSAEDQERFYYACTGWVGRNPLYNYVRGGDLQAIRESRRERLGPGLRALAQYTNNERYLGVLENFDVSWSNLDRYIEEYERVMEAWEDFIGRSEHK
ncbi:MAG: hypothetical protein FWG48_01295 [Oscillospiraceae bacterium]|nr:hypothetical protein [Oscillospiraceae bacterium]